MSRQLPEGLLWPEAGAKLMGVDYATFKASVKEGKIPAIQLSGRMHIIPEHALRLLMKYGQDWVKVAQAEYAAEQQHDSDEEDAPSVLAQTGG